MHKNLRYLVNEYIFPFLLATGLSLISSSCSEKEVEERDSLQTFSGKICPLLDGDFIDNTTSSFVNYLDISGLEHKHYYLKFADKKLWRIANSHSKYKFDITGVLEKKSNTIYVRAFDVVNDKDTILRVKDNAVFSDKTK